MVSAALVSARATIGAGEHGGVVGAVDGDLDLSQVPSADFDGERVGDRVADVEAVEGLVGGVGPVAGGVDAELAVGPATSVCATKVVGVVHVGVVSVPPVVTRCVRLGQGDHGAGQHGSVVGAVDGDLDRSLGAVGRLHFKGVGRPSRRRSGCRKPRRRCRSSCRPAPMLNLPWLPWTSAWALKRFWPLSMSATVNWPLPLEGDVGFVQRHVIAGQDCGVVLAT